jgi:quinol monooxygenase YgiN
MATADRCVTIHPYFQVRDGKLAEFKALTERFAERAGTEPGCLYYGFSFDGNLAHCREGYADAASLLFHLQNVESLRPAVMKLADVVRVEVHGAAQEIATLRGPMAEMKPQFFILESGFRRG